MRLFLSILISLLAVAGVVPAQGRVPEGKITQYTWTSRIFPGTVRDYWVYVPVQYDASKPTPVMVFQDGASFLDTGDNGWRTPLVLDELIHKGEIPVMIGIFIDPGVLPARTDEQQARFNRSYEYDALGDRYARFLIQEILPEVGKLYNLTDDPNARAIGGSSSGGIAAFTAAWERPDAFHRVLSFIGSYTGLAGGTNYPTLIRKFEPKPLRVWMQDGNQDLNEYAGNWWLANQDVASALEYAGYETKFVTGTEGHNNVHGRAVLADGLRWLWEGYPEPIKASTKGGTRHTITEILEPGADWELVSQGYRFTEGPAVDRNGNVFFTDFRNNRIHKIDPQGNVTVFKEDAGGPEGLMFGPDGRLYACQNGRKRIVAYTPDGTEHVIAEGVASNDMVVTAKGGIYFTDPATPAVWFIDPNGNRRIVSEKQISRPNGIIASPDQSLLMVADSGNKWIWSFQIQADGSLANGQPFYRAETSDQSSVSGADGMAVDTEGFLYVASPLGLQVFDQLGRLNGIISKPHRGALANVVFAGPDLQTLYVAAGDRIYKRHIRRQGVLPWEPVKPPRPRL